MFVIDDQFSESGLGQTPMGLEFAETVQEKQGERRIVEFKRSHFADFENLLNDVQWIINEANKRGLFHAQYFVPAVKLSGARSIAPPNVLVDMLLEQLRRHHYRAWVHPMQPTVISISWRPDRDKNPFMVVRDKEDDTTTCSNHPHVSERPADVSHVSDPPRNPVVRLEATNSVTGEKIKKEIAPPPAMSALDKLRSKMSNLRERSLM